MADDEALGDPLAAYRIDVEASAEGLERGARDRGEAIRDAFASRGPPILLSDDALWFTDEEVVFRVPREDVRALGQIRSTDYTRMRWGVGLYLLALVAFFLHPLVTGLLILLGGALVVLGFLSKALLVQVEDERIPPFVIEHRKWKAVREALDAWHREGASRDAPARR